VPWPHFFFALFVNALAFFRKQQRLPNGSQKCFSSFFRSEAVFDLLSISVGVCPETQTIIISVPLPLCVEKTNFGYTESSIARERK